MHSVGTSRHRVSDASNACRARVGSSTRITSTDPDSITTVEGFRA